MNAEKLTSLTASPPATQSIAPAAHPASAYKGTGRWFLGIVCAQVVLLLAIMGAHAYTLATGTEVLLSTALVDPWDIFRGNYMTLEYDISTVDCQQRLQVDDTVYVVLKRSTQIADPNAKWAAERVEKSAPLLVEGEVFIKGKVQWQCTRTEIDKISHKTLEKQQAHIRYGIEQYYIPEGTRTAQQRRVPKVLVAIDKYGNAAIKRLIQ
jgi:uncharacterized membrane-anchored protein